MRRKTRAWSERKRERKAMNEPLKSGVAGKRDAVSKRQSE